jgi:hypothetical protein
MKFGPRLGIVSLVVIVSMFAAKSSRPLEDDTGDSDWRTFHAKDLLHWAQKSGLSTDSLKELLRSAGREDDSSYAIENVDARSLKKQGQVLLSIYEFGTGHCMTVYAIDTRTPYYRKVWETDGASQRNFCTDSILGAATASGTAQGGIVVKLPIWNGEAPLSRQNSQLLVADYVWTGKTYQLHAEKRFSHYKWNGKDWEVLGK